MASIGGGVARESALPLAAARPTIGFLSSLVHGYYFGGLLAGVVDAASRAGGRVVAIQTLDAGMRIGSAEHVPFAPPLGWDRIDAFVVVQDAVPDDYLHALHLAGKPLVLISHEVDGLACPTVVPDNEGGIAAAVGHLVDHGHRGIAFVSGGPTGIDGPARHGAYDRSMRDQGLRPRSVSLSELTEERAGYAAARQLLAEPVPPTAIVAATDVVAIGAMRALREAGVAVPGDLAVVGFDNLDDAARHRPSLSTVAQSFSLIGRVAGNLAVGAVRGEPGAPGRHRAPTSLICRESCGCPGRPARADEEPAPARATVRVAEGDLAEAHLAEIPAEYLQFQRLRRHYEISTDLLRRTNRDSRSLAWLAETEVHAGCLAVWAGGKDRPAGADALRIVGTYDETGGYDSAGGTCDVRAFPPRPFLELIGDRSGDLMYLISVRFDGSDWGFLALVGSLEMRSQTALEMFNQWAVLLTVSLDQEDAVRSLVRQREDLRIAYERERVLVEESRLSEERYALAAEAANDGLWDWDRVAGTVYYSPRWKALLGYRSGEVGVSPDEWLDRVHPDDAAPFNGVLTDLVDGRSPTAQFEHRMRARDGGYRWMLTRARSVRDGADRVVRVVGSMTDVTDHKLLQDRLRRDALYDGLTGLPNRTLFLDRLNRAIELTRRRADYRVAVLFLDLDGFKVINDSLGHQAGDEVLLQVAERLKGQMRANDTAARFGGDEFAVLLNDVRDVSDLPATVDRIQSSLAAPLILGNRTVFVSAAVGIAVSMTGYDTAEQFLRDADTAMYRAKSAGSGGSALFDESMHTAVVHRLQLEADLRKAIADEQFELVYQPIVGLGEGRVVGLEALLRWRHPVRGAVSPADFLPVAESTGLILPIGRWTVGEVCRRVRAWWDAVPAARGLPVSVNLSNRQFWDPDLRGYVRQALADHDLPPSALVIELTEGVIMHNPELASTIMQQLYDDGFKLHIDDFGTGYSSLEALHKFPISALKIDRSFVSRMTVDVRSRELVRIMVAMGRNLGVEVIAEGIETEQEAAALREVGCAQVQGYLYSRPVPAAAVPTLLAGPLR